MPPRCIPFSSRERDAPVAPAPGRAWPEHEHVPDQPAERMARTARYRRGHEAVRGAVEQRHLLARRRAQGVAGRGRASRRRPAIPGAGRGCRRCGGAGSRRRGASRAARRAPRSRSARPAPAARPCAACRARPRGGRARPTRVRPRPPGGSATATRPPIECPTSAICSTSHRPRRRTAPRAARPASGRSRRCGGRCCSGRRSGCSRGRGQPRCRRCSPVAAAPIRQANSVSISPWRKTTSRGVAWEGGGERSLSSATARPSTRTAIGSLQLAALALELVADQPVDGAEHRATARRGGHSRARPRQPRPSAASAPRPTSAGRLAGRRRRRRRSRRERAAPAARRAGALKARVGDRPVDAPMPPIAPPKLADAELARVLAPRPDASGAISLMTSDYASGGGGLQASCGTRAGAGRAARGGPSRNSAISTGASCPPRVVHPGSSSLGSKMGRLHQPRPPALLHPVGTRSRCVRSPPPRAGCPRRGVPRRRPPRSRRGPADRRRVEPRAAGSLAVVHRVAPGQQPQSRGGAERAVGARDAGLEPDIDPALTPPGGCRAPRLRQHSSIPCTRQIASRF